MSDQNQRYYNEHHGYNEIIINQILKEQFTIPYNNTMRISVLINPQNDIELKYLQQLMKNTLRRDRTKLYYSNALIKPIVPQNCPIQIKLAIFNKYLREKFGRIKRISFYQDYYSQKNRHARSVSSASSYSQQSLSHSIYPIPYTQHEKLRKKNWFIKNSPIIKNTLKQEEQQMCCICYQQYQQNQELRQLYCGHNYHDVCIKYWLKDNNQCPLCRQDFRKSTKFSNYDRNWQRRLQWSDQQQMSKYKQDECKDERYDTKSLK